LSEALTSLLDSTVSPDEAAQRIANTPALVAEARDALSALQRVATAKAGPEGVKAVIGRRLATYPQPQRTEAEAAAWWADYFDVLADVSLASLEAGMRAYVADPSSEFMPKPGKLRELAFTAPCRSLQRYYRAKRAVQIADEPPAVETQRVGADEVKAILADFKSKTIPTASQKPRMPSISGKPDEGGLTPEMRKLIARRQEDAA
jgi:hypothetical protein